jgi:serine palmitoyltransferase
MASFLLASWHGCLTSHVKVYACLQATSMSAPAVEQCIAAFDLITGADGSDRGRSKIETLRANSNYFRWHLIDSGFNVLGDWDSPIMPIMLYLPGAIRRFSDACLAKHVAVVVVGFPGTSLLTARARICISACHTREDLDYSLRVLREVGARTGCLYKRRHPDPLPPLEDVLKDCGAAGAALLRPVLALL